MSSFKRLCKGSYLDGCDLDIVEWCGLALTDEQHDALWSDISETGLLERAGAYIDIEEVIEDAPPGLNDTYYSVFCDDEEDFKQHLKEEILTIIRNN